MKAKTRPAFTLVELLTVIAIIGLLISILLPALGRAREMGHRAACAANQASIMKGMLTYAADSNGQAPNWGQVMPGFDVVGKGWDWDGTDSAAGYYSGGTYRNAAGQAASVRSNARNYYILVRKGLADPKNFVCNSDGEGGQPFQPSDPNRAYDFQQRKQLSFSMQYLNPAANSSIDDPLPGWQMNMATGDPKMVMIADKSPLLQAIATVPTPYDTANGYTYDVAPATDAFCTTLVKLEGTAAVDTGNGAFIHNLTQEDLLALNSQNHRGEGQNVARLDGSVTFAYNPWQGAANDNIWTVQNGADIDNATALTSLVARVAGAYPGGIQNATTQQQMLQQWLLKPVYNKNKYPDTFLVP